MNLARPERVTATVGCCWRCRLPPSRLDRCGVRLCVDPRPRRFGRPRPAEPATGLCARFSPSRALPCFAAATRRRLLVCHGPPRVSSPDARGRRSTRASRTGPAPRSIPFASRVRCLVALGACWRRTALGPGLLAAGPASGYTLLSITSARRLGRPVRVVAAWSGFPRMLEVDDQLVGFDGDAVAADA